MSNLSRSAPTFRRTAQSAPTFLRTAPSVTHLGPAVPDLARHPRAAPMADVARMADLFWSKIPTAVPFG